MLLSYAMFSPVAKTKKGQAPHNGVKVLAQKSSKKEQQTTKPLPQTEKQIKEEEAILRAAEQYHRQLLEKKGQGPASKKEQVQEKSAAPASSFKKETSNSRNGLDVPGIKGAVKGKQSEKPVAIKELDTKTKEKSWRQSNFNQQQNGADLTGTERDGSVNIFTGNPGFYQTEGDTLNFWSLTPVPVDSSRIQVASSEPSNRPYGFEGKPIKAAGQDWTFFLILVGWTVFASLRLGFSKYIVQVFQSIFNFTAAARLYRERGYNNNFGMFRLNLIFYLFLPFSLFLIARDNGATSGFSDIEFYLIIFLAVNAYFMLKIMLYKMLGSIFSQRETTGELVFNMMLYHNVLGLLLLPVATVHAMVPGTGLVSLFLVPALVGIFYLMSIIRSIYFAFREGISIFYLILYLCTLEILPILLVVKLALGA